MESLFGKEGVRQLTLFAVAEEEKQIPFVVEVPEVHKYEPVIVGYLSEKSVATCLACLPEPGPGQESFKMSRAPFYQGYDKKKCHGCGAGFYQEGDSPEILGYWIHEGNNRHNPRCISCLPQKKRFDFFQENRSPIFKGVEESCRECETSFW